MSQINVVLSNMPGLLRDILVDAIDAQPDIEITGEAVSPDDLDLLLETDGVDLVLASDRDRGFGPAHRLIERRSRLKILVVGSEGGAASLHWTDPVTRDLGQLSPGALCEAIREAVRPRPH